MAYKKRFDCGHRGFGAYCHTCAQRAAAESCSLAEAEESSAKGSTEFVSSDGRYSLSLAVFPNSSMVRKAHCILTAIIDRREPYTRYGGKRLHAVRGVISVPIGYHFRLLLREMADGSKVPMEILSHERYNHYLGNISGHS